VILQGDEGWVLVQVRGVEEDLGYSDVQVHDAYACGERVARVGEREREREGGWMIGHTPSLWVDQKLAPNMETPWVPAAKSATHLCKVYLR
jgi:hypothetical protein